MLKYTFSISFLLIHFFSYSQNDSTWQEQELKFVSNEHEYYGLIADTKKSVVQMHWLAADSTHYREIEPVIKQLEKKHQHVLMVTNGGMFTKKNNPVGLYIENGVELNALDTSTSKKGNFYMQPNGVFYIDTSGGHITSTAEYLNHSGKEILKIRYATQSGPMLVTEGKINPIFNPESKNLNLRSGVGILPDGKIIFLISKEENSTFYEFASIFKEKFHCKNALYLDGSISKMYLKNFRPDEKDGNFGVMISVSEK
jgi:uncharacterized protein YigE (DUF2233 family)